MLKKKIYFDKNKIFITENFFDCFYNFFAFYTFYKKFKTRKIKANEENFLYKNVD